MSVLALFNIGLSGLETSDQQLQVTGNNVANSQTPDYTVEQANLSTVPNGSVSTTGTTGNGVQVSQITRSYNSFVNAQVNAENSNVSYWTNYNTAISQVQNIFNEASSAGISPTIATFFNDWQNVEQNPQDDAQRTTLISDANSLSTSLSTAATALNNVSSQLLTSSQTLVSQVNTYTAQIATLNGQLAGNPGSLDLQDQRDALVSKLNGIIKVSTYQDPVSGMFSIMVGGAPLVEGDNSYNMSVGTNASNSMRFYVGIAPHAGTASNPAGSPGDPDVTSFITGGEIKASIDLRDTQIPSYMNQLNAFATDLADTTNIYQKQGYGLDGSTGINFFHPLSQVSKYTSVDSSAGVFTSPSQTFSANGGALSIKLGDNDPKPAVVTMTAGAGNGFGGAYTLSDVANAINEQAGSKVTASVVNVGPATQFTVNNPANDTFKTEVGGVWTAYTVPPGTYTGTTLASAINGLGAGINVTYNAGSDTFSVASTGATQLDFTALNSMGSLIGLGGTPTIGTGITGTVPDDYRIAIQSNPDGNLGNVNIGVTALNGPPYDTAGSGLNLLATGPVTTANSSLAPGVLSLTSSSGTAISSVNVADPNKTVANAQYKIDYISPASYGALSAADQGNYQEESAGGATPYWRVMESTDGSTWTAVTPTDVTLTPDAAGLSRTLEFQGIKVQVDGNDMNSATNPKGETFDVQLDPNAALEMATTITDPNQVAASSDTWNVNSSNNSVVFSVNGGPDITAVISSGTYTNDPGQSDDISAALTSAIQTAYQNSTGSALPDILSAVFNPNTKQFNITNSAASTQPIKLSWTNSASTAGQIFGFSNVSDSNLPVGVSASSNDPASVETTAAQGLPGNNKNAQTIFNQSTGTMFAGTTPTDMYMSMVSNIGVDASSANTNLQYHSSLMSELSQQQQQVSGVSMDQQASNLVIYQKSYEAAAQLITTANQMLATLLQMVK